MLHTGSGPSQKWISLFSLLNYSMSFSEWRSQRSPPPLWHTPTVTLLNSQSARRDVKVISATFSSISFTQRSVPVQFTPASAYRISQTKAWFQSRCSRSSCIPAFKAQEQDKCELVIFTLSTKGKRFLRFCIKMRLSTHDTPLPKCKLDWLRKRRAAKLISLFSQGRVEIHRKVDQGDVREKQRG